MLPPLGCLAANRPSQEPPFQRRPWARDCPQVGEGPTQGAWATRGSRPFFWSPPDLDQALAEDTSWPRSLGRGERTWVTPHALCWAPPRRPHAHSSAWCPSWQTAVSCPTRCPVWGPQRQASTCQAHVRGRLSVASPHVKASPTILPAVSQP